MPQDKSEPIIDDDDINLEAEVIHVNGVRLTDDLADQIADEAARTSRERSNANLIPGRKSLSGEPGKHSPVVNVRVSEDTREGLRAVAGGDSVTKVARDALDGAQMHYVLWEQSFDGGAFEWVRFDKALSLPDAQVVLDRFRSSARAMQWRRMQIRRGRDQVVVEVSPPF